MQTWPQPVKLTTTGPMFRYDRPQAGRYRQFWQFDVEAIGDPGPAVDAEIIELGTRFYAEAGVTGVEVLVNSIGDPACRPAYLAELAGYYRGHAGGAPAHGAATASSATSLRLLDSKDPAMAELNAARAADHGPAVRGLRGALRVGQGPPRRRSACRSAWSPALVRGLDYYTRTAFEYYVAGREGQQQALGGGGRYDGLVELLGGKPTPGIGFGLGLDRVALVLAEQGGGATAAPEGPLAVVVGADPEDTITRLRIATDLRAAGLRARADLARRKLGRQLEAAGKDGRALRGDRRRRAGAGPGPGARPAGGHAAAGRRGGPRARAGPRRRRATGTADATGRRGPAASRARDVPWAPVADP